MITRMNVTSMQQQQFLINEKKLLQHEMQRHNADLFGPDAFAVLCWIAGGIIVAIRPSKGCEWWAGSVLRSSSSLLTCLVALPDELSIDGRLLIGLEVA